MGGRAATSPRQAVGVDEAGNDDQCLRLRKLHISPSFLTAPSPVCSLLKLVAQPLVAALDKHGVVLGHNLVLPLHPPLNACAQQKQRGCGDKALRA